MIYNEHYKQCTEFLNRYGIGDVELQHNGPHQRLIFTHNGRAKSFVIPATPSDHRGAMNAVSELRRYLGLTNVDPPEPEARPRHDTDELSKQTGLPIQAKHAQPPVGASSSVQLLNGKSLGPG